MAAPPKHQTPNTKHQTPGGSPKHEMFCHKKRRHPLDAALAEIDSDLFAVGAAGAVAAAAAAACTEVDAGADAEPVAHEIHGHGLCLFIKFLLDDKLEAVHVEDVVVFARLVQSHGQ